MVSSSVSLFIFITLHIVLSPVVNGIGVNYQIEYSYNHTNPSETISLLKWRNINKIRIFDPTPAILDALRNTNIAVYIGVEIEDSQSLATDPTFASEWVQTNIVPYVGAIVISGIVIDGSDIIEGHYAHGGGAMTGLYKALQAANINVPVTIAVPYTYVMGVSSPPSAGEFDSKTIVAMKQICRFLQEHGYPILANIFPDFDYTTSNSSISKRDYFFFNSTSPVVTDGGLQYFNIFDAMIDAMYTALEKAGAPSIDIVVSETGWPDLIDRNDIGGNGIDNAHLYIQNVVNHVESGVGTPKRPNKKIETYIFCLYHTQCMERGGGDASYYGLYDPEDQSEVLHINFPSPELRNKTAIKMMSF